MTLSLLPSDQNYFDVNWMCDRLAQAKNAHLFHDTAWICELPEAEYRALIVSIEAELSRMFEELMH